ncbi:MAG: hypothetical protein E6K82_03295 [Candidatus Rokuibacteriota bacterium]|nr:MAG: hypothetical protein E6K82_03295 [Candidatus Rokubacteria bacterium]
MTTILANLVARSVVSAITHTPASGPFGPVTTPPMSSLSMGTAPPAACCAPSSSAEPTHTTAIANAAKPKYSAVFILMAPLLSRAPSTVHPSCVQSPGLSP